MYDFIERIAKEGYTVPESIENVIAEKLALFYNVPLSEKYNLSNYLTDNRNRIAKGLRDMFCGCKVEYSGKELLYALYYLPINMFKIWTPLVDIAHRKSALSNNLIVLDIGCGPGTSTLGLLEFYRNLACEYPDNRYNITIDIIEQQMEFINLFVEIYDEYKKSFPANLNVKLRNKYNKKFDGNFDFIDDKTYDLIYASNVFNVNENNDGKVFYDCCAGLKGKLKPESNMIFIEPGKKSISNIFKKTRNEIEDKGLLDIYSPCCCLHECKHYKCVKFCVAKITKIHSKLLNFLGHISSELAGKDKHSFDYVVFRNDNLKKYSPTRKKRTRIGDINWDRVGDDVNIIAIVMACIEKTNGDIGMIICDGTTKDTVWLNIPKYLKVYHNINVELIRGEQIDLKGALICADNKLELSRASELEVFY